MISRRSFMGALTAVAATGALGPGLAGFCDHRATDGIRMEGLERLQGRKVVLQATDGTALDAVVDDVRIVRHPARLGAPGTEQVSVLFDADGRAGHYRLDHAGPGLDELHLSPVGMPGRDRRLEAVITRIV